MTFPLRYCLALVVHVPLFTWRLLLALPAAGWRQLWKRLPLFLLLVPCFTLLNLLHLIGWLLDELFFHRWHQVRIRNPVFIVGLPRSGTTHLQRVLAHDPQFTTFTTWEALLAPTLCEKYCWRGCARLLALPTRLLRPLRDRWFKDMDSIHKLGLNEAEEDFLLLLPLEACLLLAFLAPGCRDYWALARADQAPPAAFTLPLDYYADCLRKHLLFHGTERILLSKNPSFTSWLPHLAQRFPDAHFIACLRAPEAVVPSQFSALLPGLRLVGDGRFSATMRSELLGLLQHYYQVLNTCTPPYLPMPMERLQRDLSASVQAVYEYCGLHPSAALQAQLPALAAASAQYRSAHRYSHNTAGLDPAELRVLFQDAWPLSPRDHNNKTTWI